MLASTSASSALQPGSAAARSIALASSRLATAYPRASAKADPGARAAGRREHLDQGALPPGRAGTPLDLGEERGADAAAAVGPVDQTSK